MLKFSSTSYGQLLQRHQQKTTNLLITMRHGTVMFSVIPERLTMELSHALSDERNPLQVGGNGVILLRELNGLKVAVKKTAFRTRELNIMIKLNHTTSCICWCSCGRRRICSTTGTTKLFSHYFISNIKCSIIRFAVIVSYCLLHLLRLHEIRVEKIPCSYYVITDSSIIHRTGC